MRWILATAFFVLAACNHDPLAAERAAATAKCVRLTSCRATLGSPATAYADCDGAETAHVIQSCQNGCITGLWDEHDQLRDAGQPIPTTCRCTGDDDCASEVRYCETTTGACVAGPR